MCERTPPRNCDERATFDNAEGENGMNENLKRAFDAAQKLPDAAQDMIAKHVWEDIEKQKQQEIIRIADKTKVIERFRKIEPKYSKLFQRLAQ